MKSNFIIQNPLLMCSKPCFVGTRVSVKSLFDYLETGDSLDEFLDQSPTLSLVAAVNVF